MKLSIRGLRLKLVTSAVAGLTTLLATVALADPVIFPDNMGGPSAWTPAADPTSFGAAGTGVPFAPGAKFFGNMVQGTGALNYRLFWNDWRIESGAAGAKTNGYVLLASAGYTQNSLGIGDMELALNGFASAADGLDAGDYISLAAFWTNANMSAPAFTTWKLPTSAVGSVDPETILQNAYPLSEPFAAFGPGRSGIVGLYVSFQMGPNEVFGGKQVDARAPCCIEPGPASGPPLPGIPVPEPATAPMVAIALLAAAIGRRQCVQLRGLAR